MMRYSVTEILGQEPVTLEEVRERVHALPGNEAEELYVLKPIITAAREYCESRTGYAFVRQRITAYPSIEQIKAGAFVLPRPPVAEIEHVTVTSADGTTSGIADYQVDGEDGRMIIQLANASGLRSVNPVSVTYIAGAIECPEMARQAMLLLIGHWYQNRESVQTGAVTAVEIAQTTEALLMQYKQWW